MNQKHNKKEDDSFSDYFEIEAGEEAISQILDYETVLEDTYRHNGDDLDLSQFGEGDYSSRDDLAVDTEGFGEETVLDRQDLVESMDVDPDNHGQKTEIESRSDILYS